MPNYLERVVTSGTRRSPTVRPPLTIAPPLPALGHSTLAIETPDLESSSGQLDPWAADPGETSPTPPPPAARDIPHPLPAARAEGIDAWSSAARLETIARPGRGAEVIRAPRGLRPETKAAGAPVSSSPRPDFEGLQTPPSGTGAAPPQAAATAASRSPRTTSPGDARPAAEESVLLVHPGIAVVHATAARGLEAARDSSSSHDLARDPVDQDPASAPSPRPASAFTPPSAWLHPAPPMAGAPATARSREPQHRITIGRIDVEVHNEPPPAPPAPPPSEAARRGETGESGARLASRFLLKP
jgi:hypothetical protein